MNIILEAFNCCPECYNDKFITDLIKLETYCSNCGLVVSNNIPFTISEAIEQDKKEKEQYEELKQHKELKPIIEAYEKKQYLKQSGRKNSANFLLFKV